MKLITYMVVSQAMIPRILLCFLFVLIHVLSIAARTNPDDCELILLICTVQYI